MPLERPIDDMLDAYTASTLFEIARACGLLHQAKKPPKHELLAMLKAQLFGREQVRARYDALADGDRQVLNYLLYRGEVRKRALERELVRAGLVTPIAKDPQKQRYADTIAYAPGEPTANPVSTSTALQDVLARLTLRGLVFSTQVTTAYGGTHPTPTNSICIRPKSSLYRRSYASHCPPSPRRPSQPPSGIRHAVRTKYRMCCCATCFCTGIMCAVPNPAPARGLPGQAHPARDQRVAHRP